MRKRPPTTPQWRQIGQTIRQRRDALDLTQAFLAEAAGVDASTVCRLEKGRSVSIPTLLAVSAVLNLNPAELVAPLFTAPGEKAAA